MKLKLSTAERLASAMLSAYERAERLAVLREEADVEEG